MLPNLFNHKSWQYSSWITKGLSVGTKRSNLPNYCFGDFKCHANGRVKVFDSWTVPLKTRQMIYLCDSTLLPGIHKLNPTF